MAEKIRYIKVDPEKWAKISRIEPFEMTCIECGKKYPMNVPVIINNDWIGFEMKAHGALNECVDLPTSATMLNISAEDLERIIKNLQMSST